MATESLATTQPLVHNLQSSTVSILPCPELFLYYDVQISDKVEEVQQMQERLVSTWNKRKEYYDQLYDVQIFLRDAEQLNVLSSSQEVCSGRTVVYFF